MIVVDILSWLLILGGVVLLLAYGLMIGMLVLFVAAKLPWEAARRAGVDGVFLHGAPSFYRRFGFQPAGDHGFENPFDTPPEVFMLALLSDRTPPGGPLEYPAAFDVLSE